jgi:hypothetical protein
MRVAHNFPHHRQEVNLSSPLLLPLINIMPRFGFVGDEEVPSADSPPKQMAATSTSPARHVPTSATQREESPSSKQVDSTEQRSMMTESYTEHDGKAEIAPEAGADLETLVEQEASRVADPHLMKEARDASAHVEGEQEMVDSTVKAPVVGSEEDQYLLEEVAANWTTGNKCIQTARCISAIRNCLLEGMKHVTIANYVAYYGVAVEDQAVEVKRIKDCSRRVKTSLKEKAQGASASDKDALLKSMASLSISLKANDANGTTQRQGNPNLMNADQAKNEQHWMSMWKDARAELKKLRLDLSEEADEEVKDELKSDIDGLKKKKDEWAMLLGIKE